MLDVSKDIHSLSDFKRNTPAFLEQLREKGRALLLTLNGKSEVAVMSAETFQAVLDAIDTLDAIRGVRAGLADVERGVTKPLAQAVQEFREEHGLSGRDESKGSKSS